MRKMIKVLDEINLANHLGAEYIAKKGPKRDPYKKYIYIRKKTLQGISRVYKD